jgi:hypothetical protein
MLLPQTSTSLGTNEDSPNVGVEALVKVLPGGLQSGLLSRSSSVADDSTDRTEVIIYLTNDRVHGLLVRGIGLVSLGLDVVVLGNLVRYLRSIRGGMVDDSLWRRGCVQIKGARKLGSKDLQHERRPERTAQQ